MSGITDELRRLLNERGVEYRAMGDATFWETHGGAFRYKAKPHADKLMVMTCCSQKCTVMTPEQAVEATLGRGTCEMEYVSDFMSWHCKSCDMMDMAPRNPKPRYCKWCGRKVVRTTTNDVDGEVGE